MKLRIIHTGNFQCFMEVYRENLIKAHNESPQDYAWSLADLDLVIERMTRAIEKGSYNKDSVAFKKTCKELGIKHTYKDIDSFICLIKERTK